MIRLQRLICICVSIALLSLAGCGKPTGSVTGKVTYQDKSLKGGTVAFVGTDGEQSGNATIGEDGSYEIPALKAGTYKILVETESLIAKSSTGVGYGKAAAPVIPQGAKSSPPPGANVPEGYKPSSMADVEAQNKENAKRYIKIPSNFAKPGESGLEFTVVAGPQVHNIELK